MQFDRCVSRGRLFSCILSALIILFTGVTPIHAATINVAADALDILDGLNGVCSLREAITNINNAGPTYGDCDETNTGGDYGTDDTINLPAGLYTNALPGVNEWFNATGDLDIYTSVTISGAGANVTTIDGGHLDSVFHLWGTAKVNISDLTVTHGATFTSSPDGGSGGGIRTQGQSVSLTFTNVTVNDNEAHNGGGIFVGGPVTLNNCTVSNNKALAGGFGGGGILNYINGPLILNNSTVSGNIGGFAGGIITTSHGSTLVLNNSTVAFNTGGLYNAAGTVYMKNTVLANGGGNCAFNAGVTLTSLGYNFSTDVWCDADHVVNGGLGGPGDINNTPAHLLPLAYNGGPTKTHALCTGVGQPDPSCLDDSPAIDAGSPDCLPPATDQRGVDRPEGAACDIGAFEACEVLDGDGIADPIDTQPCVFSNAYSDGTTSGTVTGTGGWLVQVQDLPQPVGVQASISGAGTLATFLSCGASGPERVSLDASGETANITCSAAGSMTVTAQVATPLIQLRKPPTGGPSTVVNLGQGQTATIGSPIVAHPNNVGSFLVQVVDENDNQLGSFLLDPGQTADVNFPTEATVTVTNLGPGDLTVVIGAQVAVLAPGQSESFSLSGPIVPTVSEWGLVVMTLIGLTAGTVIYRRPQLFLA